MQEQTALREQRHRRVLLRERLRKIGDQQYDPDAALTRQFSAFFPRFTGHAVAQGSLEYALLLLHSDDRTYGTDDAGEANRIIRRILEHQDLQPDSETYGNFIWMTHWDRVKDRNAVSFLTAGLVYAYLGFPNKLEDSTKAALERAFPDLLAGIRNHKVPWQYTNIFFLNVGGLVSLARVLDDPSIHAEAVRDFDTWLAGTAEDGFHEYNSPTYTPVTMFGIETAWANTSDDGFRARLERTMDVLTYQLALNLFPNGFLGGAAARTYQHDVLRGNGWASAYAHLKFGTPHGPGVRDPEITTDRLMFTNLTLFDYVPPEAVRDLAANKPERAEIHDRTIPLRSRRAHVMTPHYSLSSQSIGQVGGHSPPPYVLLVRNCAGPRRSTVVVPDESYSHQPCASFLCRQAQSRVVGRLHYKLAAEQREKFLEDPTYYSEPRVLFGPREQIEAVRIGNVDWGGAPVRLLMGQAVAVAYDGLYVGAVVQMLRHDGRPDRGRATLEYGDDGELRLRLRLFGGPALRPEDRPFEALLFVDVTVPEEGQCLADYAEWLSVWQLPSGGSGDRVAFSATRGGKRTLTYPCSSAEPDPLGNALHLSPDLTLRPGDLLRLVNGEMDVPILRR